MSCEWAPSCVCQLPSHAIYFENDSKFSKLFRFHRDFFSLLSSILTFIQKTRIGDILLEKICNGLHI